jgi:hypothetical protein
MLGLYYIRQRLEFIATDPDRPQPQSASGPSDGQERPVRTDDQCSKEADGGGAGS